MAGEWGPAGMVGCLGGLLRGLALTLIPLPSTTPGMGGEAGVQPSPLATLSPAQGWSELGS